jgi:hypothetical protein
LLFLVAALSDPASLHVEEDLKELFIKVSGSCGATKLPVAAYVQKLV